MRGIRIAAVVVAVLSLAACTHAEETARAPAPAPAPAPKEPPRPGDPVRIRWTAPGTFLTRPQLVGRRVVGYQQARPGVLVLSGFDLATGHRLWMRPTSSAGVGYNGTLSLSAAKADLVAHVVKSGSGYALETVDPRSGKVLWRAPAGGIFIDLPHWCATSDGAEDTRSVCVSRQQGAETGSPELWQFDLRGANPEVPRVRRDVSVTHQLASGIGMGDDTLVVIRPGAKTSVRYAELFDNPKDLEIWDAYAERVAGQFLTTVVGGFVARPDGTYRIREALGSIDAGSGETLWHKTGQLCDHNDRVAVRCLEERVYRKTGNGYTSHKPVHTDWEGVDPLSGRRLWTRRFAGSQWKNVWEHRSAAGVRTLTDARGRSFAVDLDTGALRPLAPATIGWCEGDERKYSDRTAVWEGSFSTEPLGKPCVVGTGKPAAPTLDVTFGTRAGRDFAWADTSGLHAGTVS